MKTKTLLVSLACALPLTISAFGQGINAANGNLGDWSVWSPNPPPNGSYAGSATVGFSATGGPNGGYTILPNVFPNADGGVYTFFGQTSSSTPALVSSSFSQSIAVYLDPASPLYESGSVVIDETPASTVLDPTENSYSLWGAENGFVLTGSVGAIAVTEETGLGGLIGTVNSAGWYDFNLDFSTSEEVLSVSELTPAGSLIGSITDTSIVPGSDLAGSGYIWFTENNGFGGDPLNVADLGADPVPDVASTWMLLTGGLAALSLIRRKI
jgi:hypothetical protein